MDGVVHPNVEQAIGRDRIRKALKRYENRPADEHRYGIVRAVNEDGSYEVLLDGDVQTSRCAQYGTALVGDRVLAVTKKDGRNDLIGRLGGEIGGGGTVVTKVDDVSNYVAGRVFAHAGTNDPAGALPCDGRAVSRREYWELFDAIGTTYGAGDGSSTFNLPNIESRTIIGESDGYALGTVGGEETVSLTEAQNGPHVHGTYGLGIHKSYLSTDANNGFAAMRSVGRSNQYNSYEVTDSRGEGAPHNNMQPYIVMRYFITTGKGDPVSGINPADYVMEWGNTDGWRWEKWASGKAECWKSVEHTITSWSPWGSSYEGLPSLDQQAFPFEFAEPPVVTPSANSSYGILSVETSRKTTTTLTPVFTVTRPNVGGTDPVTIDIHVKGKWKDSPASGGTETIAPTIAERFEGIEADILDMRTNKVLWSGASYMQETQTATLSEAVSAQPNGIVLMFSAYTSGAAQAYDWNSVFVPKSWVASNSGEGLTVNMASTSFWNVGTKVLYIGDTKITGYLENNDSLSGGNGMTANNKYWVLRLVIGV